MTYWQNKVAVVTGGSAGLGLSIAAALLRAGSRVVCVGRSEERLAESAGQLGAAAGWLTTIAADVTVASDVEALFARTRAEFGRLDVLVNCAGRSARGDALSATSDEYRALWELNFLATVRCTQAAAAALVESRGHLVNLGSLAAKTAVRHLGAYPASKFALAAFSQQLRYELGPRGVHVLLVCPGPIARRDAGHRYDHEASALPESARLPGGGVRLKAIDPERLADSILRACVRRSPELVVPGRARWLFAISQLWPRLGDWLLDRSYR